MASFVDDGAVFPRRTSTDPGHPEYIGFGPSLPGVLHGHPIRYFNVPEGLKLYMVTNTDPRVVHFVVRTDPPTETDNIVWYGFNPVELEQYGDYRYDYETTHDFKLIDMGSADTLSALYDLFAEDPQAQTKLAKGFGFDPRNPTVVGLRKSEEADDVIVAHFLQKLLASTEFRGYALVGAKMKSVLGEREIVPFHPEICLVISPEDDTKLLTAINEKLMKRLKPPPPLKGKSKHFKGNADGNSGYLPPRLNFGDSPPPRMNFVDSPPRRMNVRDSPPPRMNFVDSPPRRINFRNSLQPQNNSLSSQFDDVASDGSDGENQTPNPNNFNWMRGGTKSRKNSKTRRRSQKRRTRRGTRRRTHYRLRNAGTRRHRGKF